MALIASVAAKAGSAPPESDVDSDDEGRSSEATWGDADNDADDDALPVLLPSENAHVERAYQELGCVSVDSLPSLFTLLRMPLPSSATLQRFVRAVEYRRGAQVGLLTLGETRLLLRVCKRLYEREALVVDRDEICSFAAIGGCDDKSGFVRQDELRRMCASFGLGIDVDRFLLEVDTDGSGEIEFDEFLRLLHEDALPMTVAQLFDFIAARAAAATAANGGDKGHAARAAAVSPASSSGETQESSVRTLCSGALPSASPSEVAPAASCTHAVMRTVDLHEVLEGVTPVDILDSVLGDAEDTSGSAQADVGTLATVLKQWGKEPREVHEMLTDACRPRSTLPQHHPAAASPPKAATPFLPQHLASASAVTGGNGAARDVAPPTRQRARNYGARMAKGLDAVLAKHAQQKSRLLTLHPAAAILSRTLVKGNNSHAPDQRPLSMFKLSPQYRSRAHTSCSACTKQKAGDAAPAGTSAPSQPWPPTSTRRPASASNTRRFADFPTLRGSYNFRSVMQLQRRHSPSPSPTPAVTTPCPHYQPPSSASPPQEVSLPQTPLPDGAASDGDHDAEAPRLGEVRQTIWLRGPSNKAQQFLLVPVAPGPQHRGSNGGAGSHRRRRHGAQGRSGTAAPAIATRHKAPVPRGSSTAANTKGVPTETEATQGTAGLPPSQRKPQLEQPRAADGAADEAPADKKVLLLGAMKHQALVAMRRKAQERTLEAVDESRRFLLQRALVMRVQAAGRGFLVREAVRHAAYLRDRRGGGGGRDAGLPFDVADDGGNDALFAVSHGNLEEAGDEEEEAEDCSATSLHRSIPHEVVDALAQAFQRTGRGFCARRVLCGFACFLHHTADVDAMLADEAFATLAPTADRRSAFPRGRDIFEYRAPSFAPSSIPSTPPGRRADPRHGQRSRMRDRTLNRTLSSRTLVTNTSLSFTGCSTHDVQHSSNEGCGAAPDRLLDAIPLGAPLLEIVDTDLGSHLPTSGSYSTSHKKEASLRAMRGARGAMAVTDSSCSTSSKKSKRASRKKKNSSALSAQQVQGGGPSTLAVPRGCRRDQPGASSSSGPQQLSLSTGSFNDSLRGHTDSERRRRRRRRPADESSTPSAGSSPSRSPGGSGAAAWAFELPHGRRNAARSPRAALSAGAGGSSSTAAIPAAATTPRKTHPRQVQQERAPPLHHDNSGPCGGVAAANSASTCSTSLPRSPSGHPPSVERDEAPFPRPGGARGNENADLSSIPEAPPTHLAESDCNADDEATRRTSGSGASRSVAHEGQRFSLGSACSTSCDSRSLDPHNHHTTRHLSAAGTPPCQSPVPHVMMLSAAEVGMPPRQQGPQQLVNPFSNELGGSGFGGSSSSGRSDSDDDNSDASGSLRECASISSTTTAATAAAAAAVTPPQPPPHPSPSACTADSGRSDAPRVALPLLGDAAAAPEQACAGAGGRPGEEIQHLPDFGHGSTQGGAGSTGVGPSASASTFTVTSDVASSETATLPPRDGNDSGRTAHDSSVDASFGRSGGSGGTGVASSLASTHGPPAAAATHTPTPGHSLIASANSALLSGARALGASSPPAPPPPPPAQVAQLQRVLRGGAARGVLRELQAAVAEAMRELEGWERRHRDIVRVQSVARRFLARRCVMRHSARVRVAEAYRMQEENLPAPV